MLGIEERCLAPLLAGLAANNFNWDGQLRNRMGETFMVIVLFGAIPIELTLLAARLFRAEIKDGTWANLAGLPLSMAHIAYAKVIGSLLGLAPAAALLVIGALLSPESVRDALFSAQGEGVMFVVVYGYYFAVLMIFLHLTALYSILVNAWAGVLLALNTAVMASISFMLRKLGLRMLPDAAVASALTVTGSREFTNEVNEQNFHRVERRYGSFGRSISLPQTADTEKVEASFDKGVLTVEVPKIEKAKPKKIQVNAK